MMFWLEKQFPYYLQNVQGKKQSEISLRTNPENYETIRNKTSEFEQKPIEVDDFNEIEEKQIKEWVEKQKQKRWEVKL